MGIINEEINRNKTLMGIITEQYSGIIKRGDVSCDIWCKRKSAQEGSRGKVVKMIQQLLSTDGGLGDYFYGRDNVGVNDGCAYDWENCDGKYGPETKKTIEKFQKEYGQGLDVDGKVGYDTLTALCGSIDQEWMTIHGKDWVGFTLCDQQCQCTEGTDSPGDGIQDVIDSIEKDDNHNCEGDGGCNEEWIIDNWDDGLDGMSDDCDRIKACLYYTSLKDNEIWYHFLSCMRGKFDI